MSDPADEAANRTKALEVAEMIEVLAKSGPVVGKDKVEGNGVKEEKKDG